MATGAVQETATERDRSGTAERSQKERASRACRRGGQNARRRTAAGRAGRRKDESGELGRAMFAYRVGSYLFLVCNKWPMKVRVPEL